MCTDTAWLIAAAFHPKVLYLEQNQAWDVQANHQIQKDQLARTACECLNNNLNSDKVQED